MRRRKFITLVASAAASVAVPSVLRAQEPGRTYRLGSLIPAGRENPAIIAFFDELRLNGFVEGRNLDVIPGGFGVGRDQIDTMVALIVRAAPDAIISGPDRYTRAFQEATRTIPILGMSEDMVADGLVTSLSRPDGNTTGISVLTPLLDGKRVGFADRSGARPAPDRNARGLHEDEAGACATITGCGTGARHRGIGL